MKRRQKKGGRRSAPSVMTAALAELETREQHQVRELEQLRAAIATLRQVSASPGIQGGSKLQVTSRRTPIAPGSLPDRILEILKEADAPVKTAHVVEHAKAKAFTVRRALGELVDAKRIVRTGATASLRYAIGG